MRLPVGGRTATVYDMSPFAWPRGVIQSCLKRGGTMIEAVSSATRATSPLLSPYSFVWAEQTDGARSAPHVGPESFGPPCSPQMRG